MDKTILQRAIDTCGTPAELAKRVGVTPQAVNHWRHHGIPAGKALRVSEVTGIPVEDILKAAAA
jgi:DNA-binding transcriptional regulator YdaS (Cro superfamily)